MTRKSYLFLFFAVISALCMCPILAGADDSTSNHPEFPESVSLNRSQFDEPYVLLNHTTRLDFNDGKIDYGKTLPSFIYMGIASLPSTIDGNGTIRLDTGERAVLVEYESLLNGSVVESEEIRGVKDLYIHRWPTSNWPYVSNAGGAEAVFYDAEAGLSNRPFSFQFGTPAQSGTFPKILSPQEQITLAYVPYLELVKNAAGKVTGIQCRFVNPSDPSTTLVKSEAHNIESISTLRITLADLSHYNAQPDKTFFADGEALACTGIFSDNAFDPDDIRYIRVYFYRGDSYGDNSVTEYSWRLDTQRQYENPGVDVGTITDEELAAAKEQISTDLGIETAIAVTANEGATIYTNVLSFQTTNEFLKLIDQVRTSTAIAVSQDVEPGGAVVVGSSLTFPVNEKSFGGADLLQPGTLAQLQENYILRKTFPGGGAVNLIEQFQATNPGLFTFSNGGLVMNATMVIIDAAAPQNRNDMIYPVADSIYGLCLTQDRENRYYLYIYDGAADGVAKDPISLTAKAADEEEQPGGSGGSGGCSAGSAFFALLVAAAFVTVKRK